MASAPVSDSFCVDSFDDDCRTGRRIDADESVCFENDAYSFDSCFNDEPAIMSSESELADLLEIYLRLDLTTLISFILPAYLCSLLYSLLLVKYF